MRAVADKLREISAGLGGCESIDGLFLSCLSDAIEHGDAMDELGGKTLIVAPVGFDHIFAEAKSVIERLGADTCVATVERNAVLAKLSALSNTTA